MAPPDPLLIPDLVDALLAMRARQVLTDSHPSLTIALLLVAPDLPTVKDTVIPFVPSLSMNALSRQGITQGLDWWCDALRRFDRRRRGKSTTTASWYSEVAIDAASANGHVHVLSWWWSHAHLELKYSPLAVHLAVVGGHANVVHWWKDHACDRMPLKLAFPWLFFHAVESSRMDLLTLWTETYALPYKEDLQSNAVLAQVATETGKVEFLRWMQSKAPEFVYEVNAVAKYAIEIGGLEVTRWWFEESQKPVGLDFLLTLDMASRKDDLELLEYVMRQVDARANGMDRKEWASRFYTEEAMDAATYRGAVVILDWWRRSGLHLKYSSELVISETLAWSDRIEPEVRLWATLDWWLRSGLHVDVDVSTIGWWKEPGKRWWALRKDERLKAGQGWVTEEEVLEGLAEKAP